MYKTKDAIPEDLIQISNFRKYFMCDYDSIISKIASNLEIEESLETVTQVLLALHGERLFQTNQSAL